ncbi:response regulator transcription factor [Neobacillus ginsengisoli]|uniref:DNA-binding response OmpR family regulator n=1 Tax=Neobacillus ginsengisoli TaxID=904295 RepID=A0ABT9XNU7_9BACI|nr:response regulator transcription factor [Neobacillus ginsengisoli]MDQ0197213.1 DNA-binding response OmpR family regulator [Neobacillus ginsengisoli]
MKKVLLIDDETRMLDLLSLYLAPKGYSCIKMTSANEAIHYLEANKADIILLDVMMPDMDGWEACRQIRKHWDTPIIMLTARSEKIDIVKGLKIGADDYISKPFDEDELIARMEAILRRKKGHTATVAFNGLNLNEDSFEVSFRETHVPLTPKEFALLGLFLQNRNKVFTREHLLTTIWGYSVATEDRTIDSHVRNLREKLRKTGFHVDEYLTTVWGLGYKWMDKES